MRNIKRKVQWLSRGSSLLSFGGLLYRLLAVLHQVTNGFITVSYSNPNTANKMQPFPPTNTASKKTIPMYVASISSSVSSLFGPMKTETRQNPRPITKLDSND